MKKIILSILGVFAILTLTAQTPMRPMGPNRTLPNQFRDFVDHQQRMGMERPTIEKKDGKVIITMSELQFERMEQMRKTQRFRMTHFQQQPVCQKCQLHHRRPQRGKI